MFAVVKHVPHSQKKRTMSNIYAKSTLQVSEQLASNSVSLLCDRFLPLLEKLGRSQEPVDVHAMNNGFTMDFMSAYLFGRGQSTNFTQDTTMRDKMLHMYHARRAYEWHAAELPPRLWHLLETVGIHLVPQSINELNDKLEDWNTKMCEDAEAYLTKHPARSDVDDVGNEPVVYKHFKAGIAKLREKDPEAGIEFLPHIYDPSPFLNSDRGQQQMARNELYAEMIDHLGAGHETSAIALTYLYWEISQNPEMQERLHAELLRLKPAMVWPQQASQPQLVLPEPKVLDNLPYLNAIVMETLRLHAPIPGMEPRVSPHVAGGSKLGQYSGIPGGVRVSAMPYALHRNTEVFPDPEKFQPDRWLTSDPGQLKEMHRWFWAFGSGGRMCIGSHLALQEIKLIVTAIYTNWKTTIVDDEGIEELDVYTTRPRSNRLILSFLHR